MQFNIHIQYLRNQDYDNILFRYASARDNSKEISYLKSRQVLILTVLCTVRFTILTALYGALY